MIRAVLVGWKDGDWRLFRQPQWMAEVRRAPEASTRPRRHFDIEEDAFGAVLEAWTVEDGGASLEAATGLLGRFGAVEVTGP